jgi:hypothetical protein
MEEEQGNDELRTDRPHTSHVSRVRVIERFVGGRQGPVKTLYIGSLLNTDGRGLYREDGAMTL